MRMFNWEIRDEWMESIAMMVLRAPALFFMDILYILVYSKTKPFPHSVMTYIEDLEEPTFVFCATMTFTIAFVISLLPFSVLVSFWMHVIAASLLILANEMSKHYVTEMIDLTEKTYLTISPSYHVQHLLCFVALSYIIGWCLNLNNQIFKWTPMLYAMSVGLSFKPFADLIEMPVAEALHSSHNTATGLVTLTIICYALSNIHTVYIFWKEAFEFIKFSYNTEGVWSSATSILLEAADPQAFLVFWASSAIAVAWRHFAALAENEEVIISDPRELCFYSVYVMAEVCKTPLTLIATCIAVMYICKMVIRIVSKYLSTCSANAPPMTLELAETGITEGVTLFVLALIIGLIEMDIKGRFESISGIAYIVLASLFQSMLTVTHPVLIALSTSSRKPWDHVKVLALCVVIFAVPAWICYIMTETIAFSLYTMVVISSSVVTSIQVIGHLIHYTLFMYDTMRSEPIESMDDIVYYLKSSVAALELMSSMFVILSGIKESWIRNWSSLNIVILIVDLYYNFFQRIKNGWKEFVFRQKALRRINTLDDATTAQLKMHDDVCSICYNGFENGAKITQCGHFFHGACLKKWLFSKDVCPMCQTKVINLKETEENPDEGIAEEVLDDSGDDDWEDVE